MEPWLEEIDKWTEIVPIMAKIPISAYKRRFDIAQIWKKVQLFLGYGDTQIVILGRPAVGKSVLLSQLKREASDLSYKLPASSRGVEREAIRLENPTKLISVIPGHDFKSRSTGLDEAFNQHKNLEGVIYVADWGYTPIRDGVIRQQMIERGITTIKKLRKDQLARELSDFEAVAAKIKESIQNGRGPKWLMIVVNKVDLYWDELDDAQQYYHLSSDSAFSKILKDLQDSIGSQNIEIECIPVSAWPTEFAWNEKRLKSRIGGEGNKRLLLQHLLLRVSEFAK